MYIVKACPVCSKKLRFPIDKGIINVKCLCGHSFVIDPDDTSVYKDASFDIGIDNIGREARKANEETGFSFAEIKESFIRSLFQYKYDLQNIFVMSRKKRIKVICRTCLVLAAVIGTVVLIKGCPGQNQGFI